MTVREDATPHPATQDNDRWRRADELIRNSAAGYFFIDTDGLFRDVNQAWLDMHGFESADEVIGEPFRITQTEDDADEAASVLDRLFQGAAIPSAEFTRRCRDGSVGYHVFSCQPVRRDGAVIGVEGFIIDTTERHRAELALRESESRFRVLTECSPMGAFQTDAEGAVLITNRRWHEITAMGREESLGFGWTAALHPEDRPVVLAEWAKCLEQRRGYCGEFRFIRPSGEVRWVRTETSPISLEDGSVVGHVGSNEDITERKLAEQALAAEKKRLAVTLWSIGDGVISTDDQGRVVLVNRVAEQLTGWKQEEALGRPLNEVFRIINEFTRAPCENPVDRVLATGDIVGLANHTLLVARDGTERALADSGAPIRDEDGTISGVVLVFRDVTEQQRIDRELRKAAKIESLGVLAGGIAHDFNNLLTGLTASLSLATLQVNPRSELGQLVDEAQAASRRASELVGQLLTFAKGGAPIKQVTSLVDIVREASGFALRGSNVSCRLDVADDVKPAEVDSGQIHQVFHNLVLNADQAMPAGGVIVIEIENADIDADSGIPLEPGDYVKVTCRDTGLGIPPQYVERIFDPFFTTKQKGSGLGLSTAYSIVQQHDGHIAVSSVAAEGTCVEVFLPASCGPADELEEAPTEGPRLDRCRVLVMDDESSVRRAAKRILDRLACPSSFARDGEEAIALYRQGLDANERYDLVILDLTVPGGMGGLECLRRLRELDPEVRAVVSSGYSNDPVMASHQRHGFHSVLPKPYDVDAMISVLAGALPGGRRGKTIATVN